MYIKPVDDWEAKVYVDELHIEFRKLAVHKDKVGKRSRCATVEYAGERKIGIARCVRGTVPSSGAAVLANAHSLVRRTSALTILMAHTSTYAYLYIIVQVADAGRLMLRPATLRAGGASNLAHELS